MVVYRIDQVIEESILKYLNVAISLIFVFMMLVVAVAFLGIIIGVISPDLHKWLISFLK